MNATCSICADDIPEGQPHEYSQCHGTMCAGCVKKEWPHHVTEIEDDFLEKDVKYHDIEGHGICAHDTHHGLAAVAKTKAAALKLLRKIWGDVNCVERNERYGSIME